MEVGACTAKGIRVSNVLTAADDSTADITVFLMLGALRGFNSSMVALREGTWRGHPPPPLGHDPQGKTLGILGMGAIGRNVKRKVDVYNMRVIYHNRNRLSEELAGGAEYVSFDELLRTSDVLSLNLPLNVSEANLRALVHSVRSLETRMLTEGAATHPPHHIHEGVREDEDRRRHHQHGARRRY